MRRSGSRGKAAFCPVDGGWAEPALCYASAGLRGRRPFAVRQDTPDGGPGVSPPRRRRARLRVYPVSPGGPERRGGRPPVGPRADAVPGKTGRAASAKQAWLRRTDCPSFPQGLAAYDHAAGKPAAWTHPHAAASETASGQRKPSRELETRLSAGRRRPACGKRSPGFPAFPVPAAAPPGARGPGPAMAGLPARSGLRPPAGRDRASGKGSP